MAASDDIAQIGEIVAVLDRLGIHPILVGGMALVALGSRRVTQDFDFVVSHPRDRLPDVVSVFYERGFELVSRLNDAGDVVATISNRNVAAIRLRIDAPASAFFFNSKTAIRIDLLFDFPVSASTLLERAVHVRLRSYTFQIASEEDLLRLKRMAADDRSFSGDREDIAFLEARLRRAKAED